MESECTLSLQNLPEWVTESYLYRLFAPTQAVVSVKVSKLRSTGGGRVAYMVMNNHENAARCLQAYHGTSPPNVNLRLDLAWAAQTQPKFEDFSIFVGDLATTVTNAELLALFKERFTSVFETHIVGDSETGQSKGYGFVRFADEGERDRSVQEMQGTALRGRTLRVSAAAKRPATAEAHERSMFSPAVTQADFDTANTTLFVGNLGAATTDTDLVHLFQPYGAIAYARVPAGKGCGFVQFVERSSAEAALQALQSMPLHGASLRLSWGRNAAKSGARTIGPPSQRPSAYPQTPMMHAQGTPAHPMLPSVQTGAHAAIAGGHAYGVPLGAAGQPVRRGGMPPLAGEAPQAAAQPQRADQQAQSGRPAHVAQHGERQDWAAYTSGYYASAPQTADDVYQGLYGEAAATSGEGVGHGGYTGHPDAERCASRFGFEDPLTYDFEASNRRFGSVAPPMLAPIAMPPARYVLRAGMASTV